MPKHKERSASVIEKAIDFGKQLFAAVLRSRKGVLTEFARLLRFQRGTKGFERMYNKLVPLIDELKTAFRHALLKQFPEDGLRLGVIDDTSIKKAGKKFPKQQSHHDHNNDSFYSGMKVLSCGLYQKGKVSVVSSKIVGKGDNKLEVAKHEVDRLVTDFMVDIFLFDSWYCKSPLIDHIRDKKKLFISRLRCDSKAELEEEIERLDALAKSLSHSEYEHVKIKGKSYWIIEITMQLKAYGTLRVIISKEGQHEKPIFLVTNIYNFSAKFIVVLYLKRFAIEVFFKDAKQYLNFETFMCRNIQKWDLHLQLTQVLHWAIQKKNSISRTVRAIRENIDKCLLFINQNQLIASFFEELKKICLT